MISRVAIAALVGGIVLFGLGFLVYGLALDSYMKSTMSPEAAKMMKEMPNLILLFLGNVVTAWLYAFVFERWASIKTFVTGLIGGILISLPMIIGFDLMIFSTTNLMSSIPPVIVDILAFTFISAITGGVIGQVLGMLNRNKVAE